MSETKTKLVFKKEIGLIVWPCSISVPLDDGKRDEQIITTRFKVIPLPRAIEIYSDRSGSPDARFLAEAIDGFDGLKFENGSPVPDADAKASLLTVPYVVDGLIRGYSDMIGGRTAKN